MFTLDLSSLTWPPIYTVSLGRFSLVVHSLGIVIAYAVGYLLLKHRASRRGQWSSAYAEAIALSIPGALIGSRLFWAVPFWLSGVNLPTSAVMTSQSTYISFLGGLVGGAGLGLGWLRIRKVSAQPIAGLIAESILAAVAIARVGDLLAVDHLGRQTSVPFGFRLPSGALPNGACTAAGDVCHQTALYELLFLLPLIVIVQMARRRGASELECLATVCLGYGLGRFVLVEPFRVSPQVLGLTGSQWGAAGLFVAGCALLLYRFKRRGLRRDRPLASLKGPIPARKSDPVPTNGVLQADSSIADRT